MGDRYQTTDVTVAALQPADEATPYRGQAAAANAARARATGALLLFVEGPDDADTDLVERHVAFHNAHPEGVIAAGLVVPRKGLSRAGRWWIELMSGIGVDLRHASIPASLLDDLGGFDDAFAFDLAGADLERRAIDAGVAVEPLATATVAVDGPHDWAAVEARLDPLAWAERELARRHRAYAPVVETALASSRRTRSLVPRFRDAWAAGANLDELRAYLGDEFDWHLLFRHTHMVDAEHDRMADEAAFFRTSTMYLYDLTVFGLSRTKAPYIDELRALVPPGAAVLDYGCGTGNDGLQLLQEGYRVSFADFDNPSTRFLRWRLERRGRTAPVHDLDGEVPGGFDLAYAFDVIEHVDDPFAFLAELEARAPVVLVNLLEPDPGDTHLHRELPIPEILDHARSRGLLHHAVHHRRSHLVAYRSDSLPD